MLRYLLAAAIVAVPIAALAVPADEGPPRWAANIARKQNVIMYGVPRPYAALRDPTRDTDAKLRRGAVVFDRHCTACHGWNGQGGGPDAFALVPAPADLEWLARAPKSRSEPYIYWAISEGGQPVESDMPAFKTVLSKEDRWSLVAYIRSGMPRRSP